MVALQVVWGFAGCVGSGELVPVTPGPDDPDPVVASDDTGPLSGTGDTAAPTVPEPIAECSGLPGAPGDTRRSVPIDGQPRTFLVHVPADLDPNEPAPVVLVFHGYTMSAAIMDDITTWSAVADREGFVVVYADGDTGLGTGPWNVGLGVCGSGAFANSTLDDFAFVEAMLASVGSDLCVDPDRVFGSGFSMGGYFVHNLACRGPAVLRAIAPHSGGTYDGDCDNGPVPVLVLHGSADPLIDARCGAEAAETWRERDGCTEPPTVLDVDGGSCDVSEGCDGGTTVTHCVFDGMDHGWAGSPSVLYGGGTRYADAAEVSWAFFEQSAVSRMRANR